MLNLADLYTKSVIEETTMIVDQLKTRHVGKQDHPILLFEKYLNPNARILSLEPK
ncbi:hypothetical protein BJ742DRAFT_806849 [Cladochytrium replicatum]|nr:hypothetical protein BJ742DRAFT_806849 [Cladochytrium replicatum]